MPDEPHDPRLLTVKQFTAKYPAFSENSIRWMMFHRKANGLHTAIVTIGKRVLIDEDKFFLWLDTSPHISTAPQSTAAPQSARRKRLPYQKLEDRIVAAQEMRAYRTDLNREARQAQALSRYRTHLEKMIAAVPAPQAP